MPSTVLLPAALRANYAKEIEKHYPETTLRRDVESLQGVGRRRSLTNNKLLIVDEAHRMRDPKTKLFQTLLKNKSAKRLLLTGSPLYNHPADMSQLVNIAAGKRVMPSSRAEFEQRYITDKQVYPGFWNSLLGVKPGQRQQINPYRKAELSNIMHRWIDYHPGSAEDFPTVEHETVKVPMSSEQLKVYDTLINRAPLWVRAKVNAGLPPSKQEAKDLNAFMSGVRQVSNSTAPYVRPNTPTSEPKIDEAFNRLKSHLDENPRHKVVVYSNYLQAGLNPYKQRLDSAKIPYGEFSGAIPKRDRDALVNSYNQGKIRALLLSSAGGEGLDLKGTRLIQLLEPHFNPEKLHQVEGRGVRYKSHDALPPEERKVLIQRYLATRPPSGFFETHGWTKPDKSADEYLDSMSNDKQRLFDEFKALLEHPSPTSG